MMIAGPRPDPPINVTARLLPKDGGLQITWFPYSTTARYGDAGLVTHYVIEYRTVGQWVPLGEPLAAEPSGNVNSFTWKTASRGATYQFRIRSATETGVRGEPGPIVTVHTTGMVTLQYRMST